MTSKYQAGEPWADTHDVSTGLSLARAHQLTICRSPFSEQSSTSSGPIARFYTPNPLSLESTTTAAIE